MMKKILMVIGVMVLGIGLIAGLWFGGWWVKRQVVTREASIREDTFARQTALSDEVYNLFTDITRVDTQLSEATKKQREPLVAQRIALVERMCDAYGRLNGSVKVSAVADQFAQEECQ